MNSDRRDNTVTILGVGIAGLAAAWQLEQHGYRVKVLEGSGRLGGRIHSHRFGTGPDARRSPSSAPCASQRDTPDYIDRLGLTGELRPFRSLLSSGRPLVGTRGGHLRPREAAVAPLAQLRAALSPGRDGEHTCCSAPSSPCSSTPPHRHRSPAACAVTCTPPARPGRAT